MIGFNLVPPNLRNRSRTAVNWLRVGTIFAVALTLLVASATVFNRMSMSMQRRELEEQRAGVQRVDTLERLLREARRETQALSRAIADIPSVPGRGETEALLVFLYELSAAVPDGIMLDWVEYSRGGGWLVAGVGIDPGEISAFFEGIRGLSGVEDVALAQLRLVAGEESSLRRFEVRVQWRAGEEQG